MKKYHAQHAKMTVQPGSRDELVQLLSQSLEPIMRSSGCIYYLISTTEEPDVLWISELWASKEEKDALAVSPESAKVMKELMPHVVSVTDQTAMTVVGNFGLQQ